ncbi:MAG: DNA-binding protein [Silvibacterium sp.]|nr:DNA-binding protein [Silvibacterium sp.]MBV8437046.1 DNA-binding protein [Silvibacterium sp.]
MPEKETLERAKEDLREGKSPKTAAGEFIHEEIEHVREGKHGVRSPQQAIAIGLSKARRAGIPVPPPAKGKAKESTRTSAERDYEKGQSGDREKPSARRSRAREEVLQREPHSTASHQALSRQARKAAKSRTSKERHDAAEKAVRTKGKTGLKQAAKKAAATRSRTRTRKRAA